jgi:hypothetical protein
MKPRPIRPRSNFRMMTTALASIAPMLWTAVLKWNNTPNDSGGAIIIGRMIQENCKRIQKEDQDAEGAGGNNIELDPNPSPIRRILLDSRTAYWLSLQVLLVFLTTSPSGM